MKRKLIEKDNLEIENDTFNNCSVVLGNIYIAKQTILYANYLKNVSGKIILEDGATLNAPNLIFSYGLEINGESAIFNAPNYIENRGNLKIKGSRTLNLIKNKETIRIWHNSTLITPRLRSATWLEIGECATLIAPNLTSANSINCHMYSCIYAEKLSEIVGKINLCKGVYCKINAEGYCNWVIAHSSVKLNFKRLTHLDILGDNDILITLPNVESIEILSINKGSLMAPKLSTLTKAILYLGTLVVPNVNRIEDLLIDKGAVIKETSFITVDSLKLINKAQIPKSIIDIINLTIHDGDLVINKRVKIHEIKQISGTYTYSK